MNEFPDGFAIRLQPSIQIPEEVAKTLGAPVCRVTVPSIIDVIRADWARWVEKNSGKLLSESSDD